MDELTPDEVRAVVFDHAPMLRRGYDETQVDEFLDRVESAMISLYRALAEKQEDGGRVAVRTTGPQPTAAHGAIAEQLIADARMRADQIVDGARAAAQQVVEEARAEAFRLVANASRQIVGISSERERQLTAAAAEIGDRIAQIRDALTAEVSYLHQILDEMDNSTR